LNPLHEQGNNNHAYAVATMLVALTGSASFLSLANGQAHTVNDNKTLLNDSSDGASTTILIDSIVIAN
jgi:hypothetical protein